MFRLFVLVIGIVLLASGIMGSMPVFLTDGDLFGIFEVDKMLNFLHIISGAIGIVAALNGFLSRLYFQFFGVIYAIVTILGFVRAGDLYIMHVNLADNIFHLAIAVIALYAGFLLGGERGRM